MLSVPRPRQRYRRKKSVPKLHIPQRRMRHEPPTVKKASLKHIEPFAEFDIGEGPWYLQGKRASKPEYRVAKVLDDLGHDYRFQVDQFGGRRMAGGQVIDFLLTDMSPVTVIDVRGYWHRGAKAEANDMRREFQIRASAPDVKIVIVWEEMTERYEQLYEYLKREVGAGSR